MWFQFFFLSDNAKYKVGHPWHPKCAISAAQWLLTFLIIELKGALHREARHIFTSNPPGGIQNLNLSLSYQASRRSLTNCYCNSIQRKFECFCENKGMKPIKRYMQTRGTMWLIDMIMSAVSLYAEIILSLWLWKTTNKSNKIMFTYELAWTIAPN